LASAAGVTIEHIAKKHIRKEDVVAKILAVRGDHPGLVHIMSAMEACNTYKPWHDQQTHRTFLRPDTGKCLHYYFYFIDAELGLIYLRVPTWCPFRLQFYCNGHSWLARQGGMRRTSRDEHRSDRPASGDGPPARSLKLSTKIRSQLPGSCTVRC
jgi:hypothetical protein